MQKDLIRRLRAQPSEAEKLLWRQLRAKQIEQIRFRRQYPLGPYIVDFVCLSRRLIIEADGGQHAERAVEDEIRSAWLRSQGFRVIRFWNHEILGNIEGVLALIVGHLRAEAPPPLTPPARGGG